MYSNDDGLVMTQIDPDGSGPLPPFPVGCDGKSKYNSDGSGPLPPFPMGCDGKSRYNLDGSGPLPPFPVGCDGKSKYNPDGLMSPLSSGMWWQQPSIYTSSIVLKPVNKMVKHYFKLQKPVSLDNYKNIWFHSKLVRKDINEHERLSNFTL